MRRPWHLLTSAALLVASPALAQTEEAASEAPTAAEAPAPDEGSPGTLDAEGSTPVAAPEPVPPAPPASTVASDDQKPAEEVHVAPAVPMGVFAVAPASEAAPSEVVVRINGQAKNKWRLALGGYIRTQLSFIEDDPALQFVGRNDGFGVARARTSITGTMDNGLGFVLGLDAAASAPLRGDSSAVAEPLTVRMADAFVRYQAQEWLDFRAGQFRTPFDAENLISTARLTFVQRSVGNVGVGLQEGFEADGLAPSREVGAELSGRIFPLKGATHRFNPGLSYVAAVTNGAPANLSINTDDHFALHGRLNLHLGDVVRLGGAYMSNRTVSGVAPDQIERDLQGISGDAALNWEGLTLFANLMSLESSAPQLDQEPGVTGLSWQVQLAYEEPFFGIQPAYRIASYDPTASYDGDTLAIFEQDALTHHTIGLNYNARTYPVRLMLNYTIAQEQEPREVKNDRFDTLLQMEW